VADYVTATPGTILMNLLRKRSVARGFIADFERIKANGFESVTRSDNIPRPRPEDKDFEHSGWTHPVIRQVIEESVYVPERSENILVQVVINHLQPQRPAATAIWLASWCTELHSPSARAANAFGVVVSGDYVFVAYSETGGFLNRERYFIPIRRIYSTCSGTVYTLLFPTDLLHV
jgi:hypothetical protein